MAKETKVTVCRVSMVDYEYTVVGDFPSDWNDMRRHEQEYWLKSNAVLMDTKYSEIYSIDDGSWLLDENQMQEVNDVFR